MSASANQFGQWTTGQYTKFAGGNEIQNSQVTRTADERVAVPVAEWPRWVGKTRQIIQPTYIAPTVVTRYVDPASAAGGDGTTSATAGATRAFNSLQDALIALSATNWVATNQRPVINCGGSSADTSTVSFGIAWSETLDANRYLTIQGNQPNALAFSTAHYRIEAGLATGVFVQADEGDFVRWCDIAFRHTAPVSAGQFPYTLQVTDRFTADIDIRFERCQWRGVIGNGTGIARAVNVTTLVGTVQFTNCVVAGYVDATNTNHTAFAFDSAFSAVRVYNCTVANCGVGYSASGAGNLVLVNCGTTGCTTHYVGDFAAATDHNASSGADAPGTNARNSVTPTFTGAGDYHLDSSDTAWRNQGVDLTALGITTDGDNTTRGASWDIGADEVGNTLNAAAGSYAVTGGSASLLRGRALVATAGAYALTGSAATLLRTRALTAGAGSYGISGAAATLAAARVIAGSAGSYAVTGADAALVYAPLATNYVLSADPGAYVLTGASAAIVATRLLPAELGSYAATGADAALTRGLALAADAGSYTVTGAPATLVVEAPTGDIVMHAESGTYAITGADATLRAIQEGTGGGTGTVSGGIIGIDRLVRDREREQELEEQVAALQDRVAALEQALSEERTRKAAALGELARTEEAQATESNRQHEGLLPLPLRPEDFRIIPEIPEAAEAPMARAIPAEPVAPEPVGEPEPPEEIFAGFEAEEEAESEPVAAAEPVTLKPIQIETDLAGEFPKEPEGPEELAAFVPAPLTPSPVTTVIAESPAAAVAELVQQITVQAGYSQGDLVALTLALAIALED